MTAVWIRFRAEVRSRWRAMLGLAVLLACMAGAATAAAVGAHRTESAYPRFAERYRAFDVTIATGRHPRTEEVFAIAADLPQVVATTRRFLYTGSVRVPGGKEATFPDVFFFAEKERDATRPGLKVVSGQMSDAGAPDQAMVNYSMAERLDVRPGDEVTLTITGQENLTGDEGPVLEPVSIPLHITGTFAQVGGFETVTGSGITTYFAMTPAFHERWKPYHFENEDFFGVLLRHGKADAPAFISDLHRELERAGLADGLDGDPIGTWVDLPGVQGLNHVPSVALWMLTGAIAITTIAVFSQLLAREIRVSAAEHPGLHAIGFSRNQLILISVLRVAAIAGVGAVGSALVAYLLTPLTPVGLARIAEPDPGFLFAPRILGLGLVTTLIATIVSALPSAWGIAGWAANRGRRTASVRPGFAVSRLSRTPVGLSTRSGLQMALEPGRGDRAVPVRAAVLGTSIAIGSLAAALTFAVSLDYLIREPRLAGYAWDAGAIANGFDPESQATALKRIEESVGRAVPGARVWKGTVFAGAAVEDIEVGTYVSEGPSPSIIEGRVPRASNEIAVDPRTLRQLHRRLGAGVDVRPLVKQGVIEPAVSMRIVGLFAVPRVALSPAGFARMNPKGTYDTLFVDFSPGMDFEKGLATFRDAAGDAAFAIVHRQQSTTVGNIERISSLPNVLAAIMGGLGIATLVHALSSTIRRRRRDLAILKTLGFVGRQVRATVAWQSTALVVMALAIGVPAGVAAGRWGWRLFASSLQVVPVPVVSLAIIAAIAAGAVLLANAIAAFPARAAVRTQAALVLRTE